MPDPAEERFLAIVTADPMVATVLDRAPALGVGDWWLTAGVLFQTGWNALTGRPPAPVSATRTSSASTTTHRGRPRTRSSAPARKSSPTWPVPVEICNEGRVHLWYADRFGIPAPPFRDCAEAIDSFAAVCCCYGVTVGTDGEPRVYAPHGDDDLFSMTVRRNRRLAPRHVHETMRARWQQQWPELAVLPWEHGRYP